MWSILAACWCLCLAGSSTTVGPCIKPCMPLVCSECGSSRGSSSRSQEYALCYQAKPCQIDITMRNTTTRCHFINLLDFAAAMAC